MNPRLPTSLLAACLATAPLACNTPQGAVTVNPQDGTVYYQATGMTRMKVCDTTYQCTDAASLVKSVSALAYVNGRLWAADGGAVHSCSLAGECDTVINTHVKRPVGLHVDTATGRVLVLGASGAMDACEYGGACKEVVK